MGPRRWPFRVIYAPAMGYVGSSSGAEMAEVSRRLLEAPWISEVLDGPR